MPTTLKPTGTCTKADLVEAVQQDLGLPVRDCRVLVDAVLEILKSALERGEPVKIPGFGSFTVAAKSPRVGRNPATREALVLPGRRVVRFRPSRRLRQDLDARFVGGEDG